MIDTVTLDIKGKLHRQCARTGCLRVAAERAGDPSFNHAAELFQGWLILTRKSRVSSFRQPVRVVQAFVSLRQFYEHGWLKTNDSQKIDLGAWASGKIVENGKFNAQYQITVPERFQKE
ncbi:type IV toxin-antitoxin system AbiEi family antitoxin domain-containing protein [Klebsiella pneumoniae]|nr:type IV toxin-antitoxin system AbiEi family antitoxin domain-containing protein [Klebsiella pneumoniae]